MIHGTLYFLDLHDEPKPTDVILPFLVTPIPEMTPEHALEKGGSARGALGTKRTWGRMLAKGTKRVRRAQGVSHAYRSVSSRGASRQRPSARRCGR